MDMWDGHFLAKQFIFKNYSDVAIEWIFCTVFLLVPLCVMIVTLFAGRADWWAITAIVWFGCVMGFYILFVVNIVYYEVSAAFYFAKNMSDDDDDRFWEVCKRCVALRLVHTYGGRRRNTFIAEGAFGNTEETELVSKAFDLKDNSERAYYHENTGENSGLWAKITLKMPDSLFMKRPDNPERLYTIEDVQDYRPFLVSVLSFLLKQELRTYCDLMQHTFLFCFADSKYMEFRINFLSPEKLPLHSYHQRSW